jgi:membrane-associated protease RseP (regulator of RpoE activity)
MGLRTTQSAVSRRLITGYASILLGILLSIFYFNSTSESADKQEPKRIITEHHGTYTIESQGSLLKDIIDPLQKDFAIEIIGLEHKNDIPVSFSHTSDSLEGLLKALLRYLGEKNYAFEFVDQKLKRISVLPGSASADAPPATNEPTAESKAPLVAVAEVQSVVDGSQAESMGIIPGDIILAYDGEKISTALQLVKEVEKKSSAANIELVVIRNNSAIRYTVIGGFIGVRIQTKQIPKEDYDKFNSNDLK